MKTIKGKDTYKNKYSIFHAWGTLKNKQISLFYATRNAQKLIKKYKQNTKVYINPSSTNLKENYIII